MSDEKIIDPQQAGGSTPAEDAPAIDVSKLVQGEAADVEATALNPEDTSFPKRMDIRIVADGNGACGVFDKNGFPIGMVKSILWKASADVRSGEPTCVIELYKVPVNIVHRGAKVEYKAAWAVTRGKKRLAAPIAPPPEPKAEEQP